MRVRKTAALLLAALLLCLAACGAPAADDAAAPEPETAATEAATVSDPDGLCAATLTATRETAGDCTVSVTLENHTDGVVTFILDAVAVNGIRLYSESSGVFELVEAGRTLETSFAVAPAVLDDYGIGQASSVTVSALALTEQSENLLDAETTLRFDDAAADAVPAPLAQEQTVADADGLLVAVGGGHPDAYGDYAVLLRCENATDADIQLSLEQFRYNGHEVDDYIGFAVPAGTAGYGRVTVSADLLALMDLTVEELTEVSFVLRAERDGQTEPLLTQSVTYTPA